MPVATDRDLIWLRCPPMSYQPSGGLKPVQHPLLNHTRIQTTVHRVA